MLFLSLFILPCFVFSTESSWKRCGFQGSTTLISLRVETECSSIYEYGHLAMTYTGLASLVILGDDLSRVNRAAIIEGVKALQQEDGRLAVIV
jgi:geranylgeranyl transferase type-1 subunit beta